jgi:hypothetical protein
VKHANAHRTWGRTTIPLLQKTHDCCGGCADLEKVAKRADERIWLVSFMHYDLGFFDDETCRLEPADNPLGESVTYVSGMNRLAQCESLQSPSNFNFAMTI